MHLDFEEFTVNKRFPLTISRGTTAQTTNIWLRVREEGIEGWGEATPFSVVKIKKDNRKSLSQELAEIAPSLAKFHPLERQKIEEFLLEAEVSSSIRAAIDLALYDWLGKKTGLPLWRLWGLDISRTVPISVTVGINSPEGAREKLRDWQKLLGITRIIKVKLGSPEGIEADRAMLLAIREEVPEAMLTVDANGGWNLQEAITMCQWLAGQGVKYVEQPLLVGQEENYSELSSQSPLPIFVDESCFSSQDIPRLANWISGINIKLMKAGGLTEVIRMVQIAKACGLQVMYGCYSDSSLANTAMSQLAPLADYLDLDSHLNLIDDPFVGAILKNGRLLANDLPGLGVQYASKG